jgi:hypothetical protein
MLWWRCGYGRLDSETLTFRALNEDANRQLVCITLQVRGRSDHGETEFVLPNQMDIKHGL